MNIRTATSCRKRSCRPSPGREKGQETGLINGNAGIFNNGEAFKFLRDNKVFILVNGIIYDATGRKVEVVK